ncbi:Transmembrane protein [Tumidithrix helvetica PCC 7403]|uniref:DUF6220 domain-containing protein n=1 Tax=Tumidithrix helvetica TaxID=3457545 RepID=UPI003CBC0A59
MVTNSDSDRTPIDWMQMGFYVAAVAFNLCLITQLFTVGVAYFQNPAWWDIHVWFVRGYSGLSLVLLGWVFAIPYPRKIRQLTASLPILLGLQFLSIHLQTSFHLEVLHPLIGFILVYVSASLVHSVWRNLAPSDRQNGLV